MESSQMVEKVSSLPANVKDGREEQLNKEQGGDLLLKVGTLLFSSHLRALTQKPGRMEARKITLITHRVKQGGRGRPLKYKRC